MNSSNANRARLRLTELAFAIRHGLMHACFDIGLDILWETMTEDLPTLTTAPQAYVSGEET